MVFFLQILSLFLVEKKKKKTYRMLLSKGLLLSGPLNSDPSEIKSLYEFRKAMETLTICNVLVYNLE